MNAEVKILVDDIIDHAKYCLNEAGAFYPFASILDTEGNIEPVDGFSVEEEVTPEEVLKRLELEMQIKASAYPLSAVAIGMDIHTTFREGKSKMDAIHVRLDHKTEGNSNYFLPYDTGDNGKLEFYQLVPVKGTFKVF